MKGPAEPGDLTNGYRTGTTARGWLFRPQVPLRETWITDGVCLSEKGKSIFGQGLAQLVKRALK